MSEEDFGHITIFVSIFVLLAGIVILDKDMKANRVEINQLAENQIVISEILAREHGGHK